LVWLRVFDSGQHAALSNLVQLFAELERIAPVLHDWDRDTDGSLYLVCRPPRGRWRTLSKVASERPLGTAAAIVLVRRAARILQLLSDRGFSPAGRVGDGLVLTSQGQLLLAAHLESRPAGPAHVQQLTDLLVDLAGEDLRAVPRPLVTAPADSLSWLVKELEHSERSVFSGVNGQARLVATNRRLVAAASLRPARSTAGRWAVGALVTLIAAAGAGAAAARVGSQLPRPVPEARGAAESEAHRVLNEAGWKVRVLEKTSKRPAGLVLAQRPSAGTELRPGRQVLLTVSSGPKLTEVPDVTGLPRMEAEWDLESAGLRVRAEAAPGTPGQVIRVEPAAGTGVLPDSEVMLVYGAG
jgi:hypothetical protein